MNPRGCHLRYLPEIYLELLSNSETPTLTTDQTLAEGNGRKGEDGGMGSPPIER